MKRDSQQFLPILFLLVTILLVACRPARSSTATNEPETRPYTPTERDGLSPSPTPTKRDGLSPSPTRSPLPLPRIISPTPTGQDGLRSSPTPTPTPTPYPPGVLFPDSEIVYAYSAADFDVADYVAQAGGYLSTYRQYLTDTEWNSGAQIVARMALENSINPRLLLALLEYQSSCVSGQPPAKNKGASLMGATQYYRQDLYGQLAWAAQVLSDGYYGWKGGTLTEFPLADGTMVSLPASSNAGTVALQFFFAGLYGDERWKLALDPAQGFPALYAHMFGDPWERARTVEPLLPAGLTQPLLALPFEPGKLWSFSGGPHPAFHQIGPWAALDFAPASEVSGCVDSTAWVVASAPGVVARSELGAIALDLDGEDGTAADGREQTGWVVVYLHLAQVDRVSVGVRVQADENLGHPSCEGGISTGTHVHLVRKYNGEWIPTDGPLPFILDGWTAHNGSEPYKGTLTRKDEIVTASLYGTHESHIVRDK